MLISEKYKPRLLTEKEKEGYFNWSLDFFTKKDVWQNPTIDLTLQLDVTNAYKIYEKVKNKESTFFAFLLWHLVTTLPKHFSFNLRLVEQDWYIIENPPVVIPVAVGGEERFKEIVLENVVNSNYDDFISKYRLQLNLIRQGGGKRVNDLTFLLSYFVGNLPNLRFTGLTLHWQKNYIEGQPMFYFGQRYWQNNQLYIPLAVKLHHSVTDPFVYDLLIHDFLDNFK